MSRSHPPRWLARTSPARDLALLSCFGLLLMAAGLGLRDPWPADEPRFALIARDMVHSGNWLIPAVGGEWYPDKPPLFMWAIALCYRLTGDLRIAFLLPSLLAGLGTMALVYDLARRLWGREAAVAAGLLLLLTVQFTLQARTAQIDALLTLWTTLGIYGLARHLLLGPQWRWYGIGFFAAGLGVITKGVGFLPVLMLIPWAIVRWRWPGRLPSIEGSAARWATGPAAMVLAVASWVAPMLWWVAASGVPELAGYRDDILLRQTAERYFDPWHHHKPFWYYLVEVIPWAWLPLSLLLPWLAPAWWGRLRTGDPATWLLLGWAACVLLFFTLSPGKRGVYILPALPAVVLAAAPLIPALLQRRGVQALCASTVGFVTLAAMFILLWTLFAAPGGMSQLAETYGVPLHDALTAVALIGAAGLVLAAANRRIGGAAALALFVAVSWQIHGWWVAPMLNPARSGSDLMARVEAFLPPGAELGLVAWKEQLLLHAQRPLVHFGFRRDEEAELRDALAWLSGAPDRRLLIASSQMLPCLDPEAAEALAFRHRREWRLAGMEAITGKCGIEGEPLRIRYYDPGRLVLGAPMNAHPR